MSDKDKKQQSHQKKMEKLKDNVDATIAAADIERGVCILLTGNGKGKVEFRLWHGDARLRLWLQSRRGAVY